MLAPIKYGATTYRETVRITVKTLLSGLGKALVIQFYQQNLFKVSGCPPKRASNYLHVIKNDDVLKKWQLEMHLFVQKKLKKSGVDIPFKTVDHCRACKAGSWGERPHAMV